MVMVADGKCDSGSQIETVPEMARRGWYNWLQRR